jgi:hypothetical protein
LVKQQTIILAFVLSALSACNNVDEEARKRMTPEYDTSTGKLKLLKYDSNGDGKVDMTSTMDGARVVAIEIDKDFDGRPDRWEHYDAAQKIEKVGFSRLNDGKEDAWSYADATGAIVRIDVSVKRDGKVQRVERYAQGVLATAEEDTDADGRMDKWETYDGERLAMVAFDTTRRGTPDRRLVYGPNGSARVEVDAKGDGTFVPANR